MRSKRSLISWTIIIKTTTSPARVVIMACSSRPERTKSWFSTATRMPMAGLVVVLMMMVQEISDLFNLIKTLFNC